MLSRISIKSFIPGIAWFFLVTILCCLPGKDLPETQDWLGKIYFDKWVHFGLFFILTFLFMSPAVVRSSITGKKKAIGFIALAAIAYGLIIEFVQQQFVPGRSFDGFDWAADSAGVLGAWLWVNRTLKRQSR